MRNISSCLLLIAFIFSCNPKQEKTHPTRENITESVYASAIIKSKDQYEVYATVNGIIHSIYVTENDLVKAGTPIMQITDNSVAIDRKNAALAAAYSAVDANREKLADQENTIAVARIKKSQDSLLFRRQQNLWSQNIGTKVELEQRELAFRNSEAALASAKLKYNDLLKQLEFTARQSKNNLAISETKERDFIIESKIDGKIYALEKERGEIVTPQTPLGIIGDAHVFLLEMQVDEYDIAKVQPGQIVLVTMDSYKGEVFEGAVSRIDPFMNERTKSFTVEATFTKQTPALYPNLTAQANIIIKEKKQALTIPRNYLVNDSLVLIEKDKRKEVKTGIKDYRKVEILSGLTANDLIYKPAE